MEPNSGRLPGLKATGPTWNQGPHVQLLRLERQFRVLVGVTGSVAALKLPLLVSSFWTFLM